MIWAAASVGYILIGMFAARRIFTWNVRRGNYSHTSWDFSRGDVHATMCFGGLLWPLIPPVAAVVWIGKLLVANPPETNRQREQRLATEKQEMRNKISSLERELGIKT